MESCSASTVAAAAAPVDISGGGVHSGSYGTATSSGSSTHGSHVADSTGVIATAAAAAPSGVAATLLPVASSNPRKRAYQTRQLDYAQKRAICLQKQATPAMTQEALRAWAQREFALVKAPGQSTISDILKNAAAILALDARALESKRVRSVTFPALDTALANWVLQCEARGVRVYNDLLKAQAAALCPLLGIESTAIRFSGGWLESFKDRHGFHAFSAFGRGGGGGGKHHSAANHAHHHHHHHHQGLQQDKAHRESSGRDRSAATTSSSGSGGGGSGSVGAHHSGDQYSVVGIAGIDGSNSGGDINADDSISSSLQYPSTSESAMVPSLVADLDGVAATARLESMLLAGVAGAVRAHAGGFGSAGVDSSEFLGGAKEVGGVDSADSYAFAPDGATGGDRVQRIRERVAAFRAQDVYAMQEAGLQFAIDHDIRRKQRGRATVVLCTNADGSDRREPLVICMDREPASFCGKPAEHYGFVYRSNKHTWMTGLVFRDWLVRFNSSVVAAGRRVLLLLDRATSHVATGLDLAGVEVHFLPSETTSMMTTTTTTMTSTASAAPASTTMGVSGTSRTSGWSGSGSGSGMSLTGGAVSSSSSGGNVTTTNTISSGSIMCSTGKLQPLDAGVVRAFRLKYRILHLDHALAQAEQVQRWVQEGFQRSRKSVNIFHISQLTALRWIKTAWKEVPSEMIAGCFQLHGLAPERAKKSRQSMGQIERELEAKVLYKVDCLRAYDALVESIVRTTEEDDSAFPVHQTFNPEDFVDSLTAAEEAALQRSDESASVMDSYSAVEKLDRVRSVILMLSDFAGGDDHTLSTLRSLQAHLREQVSFDVL